MTNASATDRGWLPLFTIWLVSLVATLGSLFFSEVMLLPPCVLCWYQRICMYPIVAIATAGILSEDRGVARYIWPLATVGLAIAVYHNLLYHGLIADSILPCERGVSCTTRQIEWLGFISIPLLALTAFAMIAAGLVAFRRGQKGPIG